MDKLLTVAVLLLAAHISVIGCVDDDLRPVVGPCGTGGACFPDGQLPDFTDPTSSAYYCCLPRNQTKAGPRLPDRTYNCSCVLDFTLPDKVEAWAVNTRHQGRMCVRDCEGANVTTTIGERFHYCCSFEDNHFTPVTTFFDTNKEEFIGCRCINQSVPEQDSGAYAVPPVMGYNSTGESCSYDTACQDRPSLKCQSDGVANDVTFCCYGSRGMVTQNDAEDHFTRCTCSDEIYGAQCEARPIAIDMSTSACLTDCAAVADENKCTDSSQAQRCCPHNMAVIASQSEGNFTSCTCKAQAVKNCDTSMTSTTCLTDCAAVADEDKCTDSSQAQRCCPYNMAVQASQPEGNFTSCTCVSQATKDCDISETAGSTSPRISFCVHDVILLLLASVFIGQF